MGVHSGRFGMVNGVTAFKNWTIVETMASASTVNSQSKQGFTRRPGTKDWTGTYVADGGRVANMPGETFSLSAYGAPSNDTEGAAGSLYTGTAIVESVAINWNWQTAEIVNHTVNFAAASGALTKSAAGAAVTDSATTALPGSCSLGIEVDDTTLDNVVSAAINISSALQTFINSSTACNTHRKAGPIDFSASINVEEDYTGSFSKGTDYNLKIYVDGSDYWELDLAQLQAFNNLSVNREGAIISHTMDYAMNAIKASDGSSGKIVVPGGLTNWWP